ncbi:DUF1414 domain-containing protein [Lacimicrobium sp. SS2-24]|uniref:DUF1414 domain-containing protein n=1 Tax=Lacimicrobium sp. SS2-24 TaxID=2005569 RepID=UPI000B4AA950|nr:DUF1414 domain-containing protein [Lacimicrobium sp. SS2-24]
MPQKSKYSDSQFDHLTQDLITVLEKHQADRELSLMALGNLITGIFNHQVDAQRRASLANDFTRILLKSIDLPANSKQNNSQ